MLRPTNGPQTPGDAWMKGGPRPVAQRPGMAAPAAQQDAWKPVSPPSAKPVSVGAIMGALQSTQAPQVLGVVPVHNPQPNYWNYAANGGLGFLGGTGWAGTGNNTGSNAMQQGWAGDRVQEQANPFTQPSGGSAPMSPLGALANAYQTAQDEARQANEQRYENILGGYQDRWQRAMAQLQGVGDQQRKDLNQRYDNNKGAVDQSLIARGMSNSTVSDSLKMGNERERNNAINRLEESLTRERLGYDTGLQGDLLQFMERRNDTYPDLNQLLQLAQMMGVATPQGASMGGGMGGGMGGAVPANGFPAPGNFGVNFGGGGGGGNRPLNLAQLQWLNQNILKNQTGYNPENQAWKTYNQNWTAGSADRLFNYRTGFSDPQAIADYLGR